MKAIDFATIVMPTAEQVRAAREAAGLTQQQAAELVHRDKRTRWSEWETGTRQMQPDTFELFLLKSGLKKLKECKQP